jgi:5-methylcytosine-specific restriction protein A
LTENLDVPQRPERTRWALDDAARPKANPQGPDVRSGPRGRFDVRDWIESSSSQKGPKANPKYCYEWAYHQPGQVVVLNLWHPRMEEATSRITYRSNFQADANNHRANRNTSWARRAQRVDDALQAALRDNLPIRVVLVDGRMRDIAAGESDSSSVRYRQLDPEPWTIGRYDWATGQVELVRGIFSTPFVDQFDLDLADKSQPARRDRSASVFVRDPAVRRRVLERAAGRCELCGLPGFEMDGGAIYLETHHIVPLSEGGPDDERNVAAVCAHDHRRAHFAAERAAIREVLQSIVTLLTC